MNESGSDVAEQPPQDAAPRVVMAPAKLEGDQRRRVAIAAAIPVVALALLLGLAAVLGGGSLGAVVAGTVVYGGLLSLAAGFVAVDREQARQCPACRARNDRRAEQCAGCGYDLATRPRYVCQERHRIHLDPGLCACGRRLQPVGGTGGIGREVVVILKIGGWLLAFLVGMGLLFQYVAS